MKFTLFLFLSLIIQITQCAEIIESKKIRYHKVLSDILKASHQEGHFEARSITTMGIPELVYVTGQDLPQKILFQSLFEHWGQQPQQIEWYNFFLKQLIFLKTDALFGFNDSEGNQLYDILSQNEKNLLRTMAIMHKTFPELAPMYKQLGILIIAYQKGNFTNNLDSFIQQSMEKIQPSSDDTLKIRLAWKILNFINQFLDVFGFINIKKDIEQVLRETKNPILHSVFMEHPNIKLQRRPITDDLIKLAKLLNLDRDLYDEYLKHLKFLLVDRLQMSPEAFALFYEQKYESAFNLAKKEISTD